ncbi:MAG: hypothetical protein AAF798_12010 [Bacteroidota bacterium]
MRNIFLAFLAIVVVFTSFSCERERAFQEFDELEKGAFARRLAGVTGEFNFFNVDASSISFEVEFYSEDQGQNVASYDWTVAHQDNSGSSPVISDAASVGSFPSSQFSTSANGLPGIAVTFTMQQALDALGLAIDDINGGDAMLFRGTVVLNDGRSFSLENTGSNIISSAPFSGFFAFNQNIICPSSLADNTYTVETTYLQHDFIGDGFTSNTLTGVALEDLGAAQYEIADFSGGLYAADGPYGVNYSTTGLVITITDSCGDIKFDGESDPWQNLVADPENPSFVDTDTGIITIAALGDVYGENWVSVYTPE